MRNLYEEWSSFCLELSLLLHAGVGAADALILLAEESDAVHRPALETMAAQVDLGASLSTAMRKSGRFPAYVCGLVEVGERTGRTEEALAAALCLQAFVQSDQLSRHGEARDRAATLGQTAAEAVRHSGGNLEEAAARLGLVYAVSPQNSPFFSVCYDEDWALSDARDCAYCLRVEPVPGGTAGLGRAAVSVVETAGGSTLFSVEAAWQEVRAGDR